MNQIISQEYAQWWNQPLNPDLTKCSVFSTANRIVSETPQPRLLERQRLSNYCLRLTDDINISFLKVHLKCLEKSTNLQSKHLHQILIHSCWAIFPLLFHSVLALNVFGSDHLWLKPFEHQFNLIQPLSSKATLPQRLETHKNTVLVPEKLTGQSGRQIYKTSNS